MFAVEKQLRAAIKFLDGVKSLPGYAQLEEKQVAGILLALSKLKSLTVVQAGSLLSLLEGQTFAESNLEKLKSAIADKAAAIDVEAKRKGMQDYTMFPYYLSEHVWEKVLDQKLDRGHCLDVLLSYVGHLGLRRPTELTISVLVTLAYKDKMGSMNKKDLYQLLQSKKASVKKALAAMTDPLVDLEYLPQQPDDLPQSLRDLTCGEFGPPVDPKIVVHDLFTLANSVPLRKTNSDLATEEKNEGQSSAVSMGQAFAECFKQALQVTRPQSTATSSGHAQEKKPQLALRDIPERQREDLLSQGNKLPEKQKDTVSDVVRNTEPISKDVDTDGFPTVPVQGAAKCRVSLAESVTVARGQGSRDTCGKNVSAASLSLKLASLKQDLCPDDQRSPERTVQRPAANLKRPAASMKRPSAGNCKKRPAIAAPSQRDRASGSSGKPESRSERKQRLMETIPMSLKKQFQTGCPKCRYTANCTPSCWKERGYALDD